MMEIRPINPQFLETGQQQLPREDGGDAKGPTSREMTEAINMTSYPVLSNPAPANNHDIVVAESRDDFIVRWEEPEDQDPENPLNWSSFKKWSNICTIALISFVVYDPTDFSNFAGPADHFQIVPSYLQY